MPLMCVQAEGPCCDPDTAVISVIDPQIQLVPPTGHPQLLVKLSLNFLKLKQVSECLRNLFA